MEKSIDKPIHTKEKLLLPIKDKQEFVKKPFTINPLPNFPSYALQMQKEHDGRS